MYHIQKLVAVWELFIYVKFTEGNCSLQTVNALARINSFWVKYDMFFKANIFPSYIPNQK